MRKALILTVFALFGSESLAQNSFRRAPAVTFDDLQDNEMALNLNYQGAVRDTIRLANNDYRVKVGRWDDSQDNEMFGGRGTIGGPTVLINRPTGGRMGMMDDYEDDAFLDIGYNYLDDKEFDRPGSPLFGRRTEFIPSPVPSDTFASQNPSFLGSGNSGVFVQGGNAPQGGIGASGSGQYVGNIGNTGAQYLVGATVSHNPGAPVTINPHVGVKIGF